ASIALARAYPALRVDGFDIDAESIAQARDNAAEAGVADRTSFEVRDAAGVRAAGAYDVVCLFDVLHELPQPVEMLRASRALRAPGGSVLVMDAKVADAFTAPADEVERFQYTTSVLHCLPASLAEQPSAATGTVMRPSTVRAYAGAAGFSGVEVLPIAERFHRLYRLTG
ncbi:MAG: class I SAM-dependent methyltransferase, partial [Candidatus Eremiobacteraeota bacterium]|nr:class I SAM-dependent methyltransferase [Candidatus Eremiobacteraeota bacterium]